MFFLQDWEKSTKFAHQNKYREHNRQAGGYKITNLINTKYKNNNLILMNYNCLKNEKNL